MTAKKSQVTNSVLVFISKHPDGVTFLDVERAINTGGNGLSRINIMKKQGLIVPLPKVRNELKRYILTSEGNKRVQTEVTRMQRSTVFAAPVWTPPAWVPSRAGSMDALAIQSRGF